MINYLFKRINQSLIGARRLALCCVILITGVSSGHAAFAQNAMSDADSDGFSNSVDNCAKTANADQTDADQDGYGNRCDADLNNDQLVNFLDFAQFTGLFMGTSSIADFNADGLVNFLDFGIFVDLFQKPPGPSGVVASSYAFTATPVFTGFSTGALIEMKQTPSQPNRWYGLQRNGRLISFPNDPATTESVESLNIISSVDTTFEGGALGFAFHPDFATNGYVYISYTATGPDFNTPLISRISRFETALDNGISVGDRTSEVIMIAVDQPASNHNGGHIAFGPDGYLYWGLGDGGGSGDTAGNGQNTKNLLATMVRIDVNVTQPEIDAGTTYKIPPGNVFADDDCTVGCPEIFAWGLRNPWRFSFDGLTDELWVGDVGQNAIEEVTMVVPGGNHGWRCYEGNQTFNTGGCDLQGSFVTPVHTYTHALGYSITGGYVYRGLANPPLHGMYIFADYGSGTIWGLYESDYAGVLINSGLSPVSFAQDLQGELYFISLGFVGNSQVRRIDVN